ncbi:MAG: hypothetical protein E7105_06925 [Prevotella sp.]|nr:hypothetical protein [Prevotella sp.]
MKKEYIAPHAAVYQIEPAALIAESFVLDGTSGNKLDSGDILSKESGDWDIWGTDNGEDDYDY